MRGRPPDPSAGGRTRLLPNLPMTRDRQWRNSETTAWAGDRQGAYDVHWTEHEPPSLVLGESSIEGSEAPPDSMEEHTASQICCIASALTDASSSSAAVAAARDALGAMVVIIY